MTGLQEELERLRAQRFAAYPAATLAALALLPRWTDTLARTAELGAVPEELVESTMLLLDDGGQERAFWVRESVRAELGAYLRREHADTLRRALRRLTGLLYRVDHDWFTVADVHEKDPTGLRLLREVSDRVEAGRLPEAARLVATAEALADVLGGHLTGSARRAAWRLARATREAEDAHRLRHYQRRDEIEEEMLVGPSWAVHLLGSGGAGKTMLVRRLATRVTTARVDFDHLDPRYPESRPGEMFTALAVDLLGWVGSRAGEAAYRRFLDAVEELHEELARPYRLESRTEPLLDRMVAAFAGLLTSLDQEVTLVLDTCEELAKLYPPGEPAPGIDMTFALLERLHALVPSLRVVLAGRRWLVPPPSGAPSGPLLRPRPYLRVLPVGGFTRAEAERYLTARGLPPRFTPAVLSRAAGENGYNPFDLAVHADWVLAEPSLDPASLVTDPGDPYIERRVIGRLRDPALVRCLGVAAELGTLDRALAAAEFAALGVEADAVFGELAAQEWARVRAHTPDGRPSVVELEAQLCARLRAVTSADPDRFPLHGRRLGRTAAELVRGVESIAEAPVATLLAALRLLPSGEALALWAEVEARVVAERAWGWAEHVTARAAADLTDTADRLLSHPSPFSPERSDSPSPDRRSEGRRSEDRRSGGDRRAGVLAGVREVLAAVLSTQAATRVQTGGGGVAALWWHVLRFGNAVQRDRALLGLVSAGEGDIDFPAELRRIVATGTNLAAPDAETGAEADEGTKSTVRTPAGSTVGVLAGSIAAAADRWMIEGRWSDLRAADLLAVAEAGVDPAVRSLLYGQAALLAQAAEERTHDPRELAALAVETLEGPRGAGQAPALFRVSAADFPPGCDARARAALVSLLIRSASDEPSASSPERRPPGGPAESRPTDSGPAASEPDESSPAGSGPADGQPGVGVVDPEQSDARPVDARPMDAGQSGVGPVGGRRGSAPVGEGDGKASQGEGTGGPREELGSLEALFAAGLPRSVDADRWLSLTLLLLCARGRATGSTLGLLPTTGYPLWRGGSAWVHRRIQPFAVSLAWARMARGEYGQAAAVLRARLREALEAGDDPATVEECQLALLMVCRRERDLRHYPGVRDLSLHGSPLCRAEAWLTLTLVEGERPRSISEAGSWYGWWRCQDVNSLQDGHRPPPRQEEGVPAALLRAAATEASLLTGGGDPPVEPPGPLDPRLGWVRGVTLLTEAEVLALRFPAQAARLLEQASVLLGRDSELGRQAALLAAMAGIRSGAPLEAGRREPAKPLSGGWVVRTTALSRLSWTTSVSGLPELALPDLSRPSLPQWVYGGEQPLGRPDQSADDPTRGERGSDRLLPTRRRPPADAREQPDDGSPHPQRRPSVNDQDPAPTTAEDEPESEWISGWKIAAVLVAFVGVVAFQAFLPQIMSALGPTVVVAGCVLAAAAGAVHWSGILSTAMTAEISDGSTDLLLHGSGEWRGQAWGPGVPTWLAPSRHVATVRTTWHEARPRPWVKAVRLVSTNRVIDGDVEFGLFGHLPPARLPAMFRSFHSRARLTPVSPQGDYRGPDHLAPRALSGGRALWVGTLVRTADGLRLRVADDRSAPSGAQSRERLMDLAPPPDFVVLQAEPVDGPPEPLGSAHALAASLARALCEGGTPAALVVPPLPDELAAQVIAACADWPMWRQGEVLDARSLLRLQRHLRKIIGAGSEVLCDLILFLPIDPEDE